MDKTKSKALQQIMEMLSGKELDGLKKHSPKLMTVTIEAAKPKDDSEDEAEKEESPLKAFSPEMLAKLLGEDEEDDEDEGK